MAMWLIVHHQHSIKKCYLYFLHFYKLNLLFYQPRLGPLPKGTRKISVNLPNNQQIKLNVMVGRTFF